MRLSLYALEFMCEYMIVQRLCFAFRRMLGNSYNIFKYLYAFTIYNRMQRRGKILELSNRQFRKRAHASMEIVGKTLHITNVQRVEMVLEESADDPTPAIPVSHVHQSGSDAAHSIEDKIRNWAITESVNKSSVSKLLKILKNNNEDTSGLPCDYRTLVHTPRCREIIDVDPGKYCHLGLHRALDYFCEGLKSIPSRLTVDINIDGVPLSKSSSSSFWVILAQIFSESSSRSVHVVGIYHGYQKPKDFGRFLEPLVNELETLGSYCFHEVPIQTKLRCIVCDAPARNSCLGTKSHTGYFGCGRCIQEGVHDSHRMTFPERSSIKRTNESFRSRAQEEHHISVSPFLKLDIDMISQFPIDYLHCVLLGVVKKMTSEWLKGGLNVKLQTSDVTIISNRLLAIAEHQPTEFQSKCRSLKEFGHFKGTEFRTLIVYAYPVVLKDVLPVQQYEHVLLLHSAILILIDPHLCRVQADVAQCLLMEFVRLLLLCITCTHFCISWMTLSCTEI